MKEVKHGIALAAGFITDRGIDRHTTFQTKRRTIIPYPGDGSVRHRIDFIKIGTITAYDKYVG